MQSQAGKTTSSEIVEEATVWFAVHQSAGVMGSVNLAERDSWWLGAGTSFARLKAEGSKLGTD